MDSFQTNRDEPEGSYLIRFSKSRPGSFALAFKDPNMVNHILIHSDKPRGFRIYEQDTNTTREFPSITDIIKFYSYVLKTPFTSSLPKERQISIDAHHSGGSKETSMEKKQLTC